MDINGVLVCPSSSSGPARSQAGIVHSTRQVTNWKPLSKKHSRHINYLLLHTSFQYPNLDSIVISIRRRQISVVHCFLPFFRHWTSLESAWHSLFSGVLVFSRLNPHSEGQNVFGSFTCVSSCSNAHCIIMVNAGSSLRIGGGGSNSVISTQAHLLPSGVQITPLGSFSHAGVSALRLGRYPNTFGEGVWAHSWVCSRKCVPTNHAP